MMAMMAIIRIRPGVEPFPFSASASGAEHELALIARLAEFAEAGHLITARCPCSAGLADYLWHLYYCATEAQRHRDGISSSPHLCVSVSLRLCGRFISASCRV